MEEYYSTNMEQQSQFAPNYLWITTATTFFEN